jgi:hypothetical protein
LIMNSGEGACPGIRDMPRGLHRHFATSSELFCVVLSLRFDLTSVTNESNSFNS